jgi:hypothetical protein
VVELEHKAQGLAAQAGQPVVVLPVHGLAGQLVGAAVVALQQAQDVEQGALARSRGANEGGKLAALDLQVDAVQHLDLAGQSLVVDLAHAGQVDQGLRRGRLLGR